MNKRKKRIQIISDKAIEPFIIYKDDYCFSVKENIISDGTHHLSKKAGNQQEKVVGHYPKIEDALTAILRKKSDNDPDYNSLKDYIANLENNFNEIKKYYEKIRSTI